MQCNRLSLARKTPASQGRTSQGSILPSLHSRAPAEKMLTDCHRRTAPAPSPTQCWGGEIDQTHYIRNEMTCHAELCRVSRRSEGRLRDNPLNKCCAENRSVDSPTSPPSPRGGVTVDACCRSPTRRNPGAAQRMMINHLLDAAQCSPAPSRSATHPVTCNNVTAAHRLRKMPAQVEQAAAAPAAAVPATGHGARCNGSIATQT